MKRLLVVAVVMGFVGMAMVAGAATPINNWCTGTYQLTGASAQAITLVDSAVVSRQLAPNIQITKLATNMRTGQTDNYSVNAVVGDNIVFTIIWANTGEATADVVILSDYIPTNFNAISITSDTRANCTSGSSSVVGNAVTATETGVAGIDPGPAGNGIIKIDATLNN